MGWTESISIALQYIETHLSEPQVAERAAEKAALSSFYFQKGFAMLCGMTVHEYIRKRRLSKAGRDVLTTDLKIIDIALDCGYQSPDSFTKAFTRFHGITPTALRKSGGAVISFDPLKIKITLEGGNQMKYQIVKKEAFSVLCCARKFSYQEGSEAVPCFWKEHLNTGGQKYVAGVYGINIDKEMDGIDFEYLIADPYDPAKTVPDGYEVRKIPEHLWAIFPCYGKMSQALPELNRRIFTEWLPSCSEYTIAEGINIEMYTDASKYQNGIQDEQYYCEVWIPVCVQ